MPFPKDDIFNIWFITVCSCTPISNPPQSAPANSALSNHLDSKLLSAKEFSQIFGYSFDFGTIFHRTLRRWICVGNFGRLNFLHRILVLRVCSASKLKIGSSLTTHMMHSGCEAFLHRVSASKLCFKTLQWPSHQTRQRLQINRTQMDAALWCSRCSDGIGLGMDHGSWILDHGSISPGGVR